MLFKSFYNIFETFKVSPPPPVPRRVYEWKVIKHVMNGWLTGGVPSSHHGSEYFRELIEFCQVKSLKVLSILPEQRFNKILFLFSGSLILFYHFYLYNNEGCVISWRQFLCRFKLGLNRSDFPQWLSQELNGRYSEKETDRSESENWLRWNLTRFQNSIQKVNFCHLNSPKCTGTHLQGLKVAQPGYTKPFFSWISSN